MREMQTVSPYAIMDHQQKSREAFLDDVKAVADNSLREL
jgi:hypothetical protein